MIRIIGYSSDDLECYKRHGGKVGKPKRHKHPNKCCYCHSRLTKETRTKDHLVPKDRGGKDGKYNLRPCCRDCNKEKDNMLLSEYVLYLEYMLGEYPLNCSAWFNILRKIDSAKGLSHAP